LENSQHTDSLAKVGRFIGSRPDQASLCHTQRSTKSPYFLYDFVELFSAFRFLACFTLPFAASTFDKSVNQAHVLAIRNQVALYACLVSSGRAVPDRSLIF